MVRKVIVDSDAIFAIYNPNDPLNSQSIKTFQQLITQNFQLYYPTSVLFEVISLFQRVLPNQTITTKLVEMIKNDQILIYYIDQQGTKEAASLFNPSGSKKNTLIDCSVVIAAQKIKAQGVFSYDSFYIKQGLKLAKDLI